MMMWGDPEELDVWNQIVDEFDAANTNITVYVDVSDWESYWTKLDTLLAAGYPTGPVRHRCPLIWIARAGCTFEFPILTSRRRLLVG